MEVLERDCVEQPGCDVLTIPHNSNLSGGKMFPIGDETLDADTAARQERMQPLLEVMQHKGDSECWFGLGAEDELCAFETLPFKNFSALFRRVSDPASTPEPVTPENGFARVVLTEGLRHEARIGVNPWRLGLIAATDTHAGLPGSVAEDRFQGHTGGIHPDSDLPGAINFGPGGLTAVWAEENTRDALFSAMRRREVYGTSGPRISLRFFGGWDYSQQLCGQSDFVRRADRGGVPMGARMKPRPAGAHNGPRFAVLAQRDPGVPGSLGTPLQRVQIIKGWVDGRRRAAPARLRCRWQHRQWRIGGQCQLRAQRHRTRSSVRGVVGHRLPARPARLLLRTGGRKPQLPLECLRLQRSGHRLLAPGKCAGQLRSLLLSRHSQDASGARLELADLAGWYGAIALRGGWGRPVGSAPSNGARWRCGG